MPRIVIYSSPKWCLTRLVSGAARRAAAELNAKLEPSASLVGYRSPGSGVGSGRRHQQRSALTAIDHNLRQSQPLRAAAAEGSSETGRLPPPALAPGLMREADLHRPAGDPVEASNGAAQVELARPEPGG